MQQELCNNSENGRAKVRYKTRAQAEKAARRSEAGLHLRIYRCFYEDRDHFHLTSRPPREHAATPPSAAKLRRRLENAGREIAAASRRLEAAEKDKARREEKARRVAEQSERDHAEVLSAVARMVDAAMAGREPSA